MMYIVTVCRTGYGFADIPIEADSQAAAEAAAIEEAGNYSFSEKTSEYSVAGLEPLAETLPNKG